MTLRQHGTFGSHVAADRADATPVTLPEGTRDSHAHHPLSDPLSDVSERIDALEGHLAQLLARQREGLPAPDLSGHASAGVAGAVAGGVEGRSDRIVRSDLQFDEVDDHDGFDQRFTTFTDNTEVDERSRNWLLS